MTRTLKDQPAREETLGKGEIRDQVEKVLRPEDIPPLEDPNKGSTTIFSIILLKGELLEDEED